MIVDYDSFRCGLTFADIVTELRHEARQVEQAEGRRMFWTRNTVLGRFRQRKLEAYSDYVRYMQRINATLQTGY